MRSARPLLLALQLATAAAGVVDAAPLGGEGGVHRSLLAASVVLDTGCTGALAESRQLVVTAYHCVVHADQKIGLRFSTGERRVGWIVGTDEVADQAVLFLEDPIAIEPLSIVRRRPIDGTVLYFAGHPDRPRFQSARLDHVGRCSSLPSLPNALFTSIDGKPGDSGAPLVDGATRILGLVHGGARCHIATPADTLLRLIGEVLDRAPLETTRTALPSAAPSAASQGRLSESG